MRNDEKSAPSLAARKAHNGQNEKYTYGELFTIEIIRDLTKIPGNHTDRELFVSNSRFKSTPDLNPAITRLAPEQLVFEFYEQLRGSVAGGRKGCTP